MKKILFFTSSRSDFGIQLPLIKKFVKSKRFKTYTIVTGSHFSKTYGSSYKEIKKSGIKNTVLIDLNYKIDSPKTVGSFLSKLILRVSYIIDKIKPNYLMILGDRFEIIIPTIIANHFKIPIIHFHGGEVTEGSMDELTRHAISKMSQIHFPCTTNYKKRLIQLGENPKNIHNFGSISLSDIKNVKIIKKKKLLDKLKIYNQNKNIIVTFHPEFIFTKVSTNLNFKIVCAALSELKNFNIIFTAPAQELNSDIIIKEIQKFCKKNKNSRFFKSMGKVMYLSCLKSFDLMIGNSSSGIIESPYFNIPAINLGKRQAGRDMSLNIINCKYNKKLIINKINYAISNNFRKKIKKNKSPYYQKDTIEKIYKEISKLNFKNNISKKFIDL